VNDPTRRTFSPAVEGGIALHLADIRRVLHAHGMAHPEIIVGEVDELVRMRLAAISDQPDIDALRVVLAEMDPPSAYADRPMAARTESRIQPPSQSAGQKEKRPLWISITIGVGVAVLALWAINLTFTLVVFALSHFTSEEEAPPVRITSINPPTKTNPPPVIIPEGADKVREEDPPPVRSPVQPAK
jgi:hypothetical protein